jgi:hypothetical protein
VVSNAARCASLNGSSFKVKLGKKAGTRLQLISQPYYRQLVSIYFDTITRPLCVQNPSTNLPPAGNFIRTIEDRSSLHNSFSFESLSSPATVKCMYLNVAYHSMICSMETVHVRIQLMTQKCSRALLL